MRPLIGIACAVACALPLAAAPVAASEDTHGDAPTGSEPGTEPAVAAFCGIGPIRYVVQQVGRDVVSVDVLVRSGQSPHTFEPTPRQMAELAEADVYFSVGLPFELQLVERIGRLNPDLVVVDTARSVGRRRVEESHEHGHDHDDDHDDDHGDEHGDEHGGLPDPHVWLDPLRAEELARTICGALSELVPHEAARFDANLSALLLELNTLHEELLETLKPVVGERVYVYHPAFGYFTDAYGLVQVPIELGGTEPGARELAQLIGRAKADGVRVIFVQPQFSSRTASAIAEEIGGAVVPIDPLSENYFENLRLIAHEIRKALSR